MRKHLLMVWNAVFTKSCSINCDHCTSATFRSASTTPSNVAVLLAIKSRSGRVSSKNPSLIFFGGGNSTICIVKANYIISKRRLKMKIFSGCDLRGNLNGWCKNKYIYILWTNHQDNWRAIDGDTHLLLHLYFHVMLHIDPVDRIRVAYTLWWRLHNTDHQFRFCEMDSQRFQHICVEQI